MSLKDYKKTRDRWGENHLQKKKKNLMKNLHQNIYFLKNSENTNKTNNLIKVNKVFG